MNHVFYCQSPHCYVRPCQFASFNRDSQDIPESRRKPILTGMSGEERVSVARHALLFESRLTSAAYGRNQNHNRPRFSLIAQKEDGRKRKHS